LETGRNNQIRVHMQDLGHSVVGDKKYGAANNPIRRLALHARVLAFRHPVTGETLRFESPMPKEFTALL
jgi:23S rRNA pseudouridine1911/1915/1917 synthase